jgi:DNA-binding LacI/PurR family transcriptional regulator
MKGMMKHKVTSIDVARLAQVSQSAVSRTYTPGASVSEDTRVRVLDAARKLGYRPNAMARSLITKRSRIIGVVMAYLDNQFYPLVLEELSKRLQRDGYHVLLFISDTQQADGVLAQILQYQVDGIVMMSTMMSSALARDCADAGIPVVLFNRMTRQAANEEHLASAVISDNEAGGRLVARYFVQTGHQRIAYIAGIEDSSTSVDRERGFREELAKLGSRMHARAIGHYTFEGAQQAARELFRDRAHAPDALFVASDHMAIAVMDVLRIELGLRVPEDVSVIGFDNVPQAAWGSYRLTTVEQPVMEMIEAAATLIHEQLDADKGGVRSHAITVPCRLIERASVMNHVSGSRKQSGARLS